MPFRIWLISASRAALSMRNIYWTSISDLPFLKCKYSSPLIQHWWNYATADTKEGRSQCGWPLGDILHTPEEWLTSETVATADEGQAPFPAVPPSSLSRSTALFWARTAYTTPSNNSLAGNYSPVQPLITSGGRLVGLAVMWCSRILNSESMHVELCGSTEIVHWTEALLNAPLPFAAALWHSVWHASWY